MMTMMKQMKRWPAFLLPALLVCACGPGSENTGEIRWKEIPLAMDSLAIDQILAPTQMQIKGDLAVVMSGKTDTIFHVFSLPDFHFLYKDGVSGEGPDDFSFGRFVAYPSDSVFCHSDLFRLHAKVFRLSDTGFEKEKIFRRGRGMSAILSVVNDSIMVVEKQDWDKRELGVYVYNHLSGQITDSLSLKTYMKDTRISTGIFGLLNQYAVFGYGDRFVVSYYFMDRVEFYRVSPEGKTSLYKAWGKEELPDYLSDFLKRDERKRESLENLPVLEGARIYYGWGGYATSQHIFMVSGKGMTPEEQGKKQEKGELDVTLDVFTWDGDPVGRMHLPLYGSTTLPFAVSEKYSTIYAVDPQQDFDQIYTFRYDKL